MARRIPFLAAAGALVVATYAGVGERVPATGAPGPEANFTGAPGTLVVDLLDGTSASDRDALEALLSGGDLVWYADETADEALAVAEVADVHAAIEALRGNPLVEAVEGLVEHQALGFVPDDPLYEHQWNLRAIGMEEVWASGARGQGVTVAVIDTGVSKVEDLGDTKILPGKSFVLTERTAEDGNGHGTHVAGTIAQSTDNGVGVAGIAPEASILPVKVLSKRGFGSSPAIAAGIDWAVDNGADVINMSLGGGYSKVVDVAVQKARAKGVVVVAAVGNSGRKGVSYPGGLEAAIGVSATGPDGTLAPYSSWGKGTDISAPGGDKRTEHGGILQDTVDGKGGHHYAEYQGTSMATPHVAGAAAVLLSSGALDADAVEQALMKTAKGDGWDEKYGNGRLDLAAALGKAKDQKDGTLFGLGAALAALLAAGAGAGGGFRIRAALWGGMVAGGLFFVPGLASLGTVGELLSRGVLAWPALLFGPEFSQFPLWLSAMLPAAGAFVLGASRHTRALAMGLTCGVGAHLVHGAATGALDPLWLGSLGGVWLLANGLGSLGLGFVVAATQSLEEKQGSR